MALTTQGEYRRLILLTAQVWISQKKCVLNCHIPAPSSSLVTRQSRHFYHLNKTFRLMYVFMLPFKGCRVWTFSNLLGREDTQGRGPPSCYALHEHLLHRCLCSLKPSFCLCCKARANTPLLPKIKAAFPPAQVTPAEAWAFCRPAHTASLPYTSEVVFQSNPVPIY